MNFLDAHPLLIIWIGYTIGSILLGCYNVKFRGQHIDDVTGNIFMVAVHQGVFAIIVSLLFNIHR